jgi:hypothetical protein
LQPSVAAEYLYDAVYIYLTVIDHLIANNKDYSNGEMVTDEAYAIRVFNGETSVAYKVLHNLRAALIAVFVLTLVPRLLMVRLTESVEPSQCQARVSRTAKSRNFLS